MSTEVVPYESPDFGSIRTIDEDGDIYFVASDVAKVLGQREAERMTRYLFDDEKAIRRVQTPGGEQEVTVITEPGFYHALNNRRTNSMADADARARVEAFQRWVTHEVLPSIRKTGAYANPQFAPTPEERFALALKDADVVIANMRARMESMAAENEEMRPKAELADAMLGSEDTILVRELANLITQAGFPMRQKDLFERLRDEGFLIRANTRDRNQPTRYSIDHGLMEVREGTFQKYGRTCISRTPRITPKGQAYFLNRYACARTLAVDADG